MKPSEQTVRSLLKSDAVFSVPPFQRHYCWQQREFERLWEDLLGVLTSDQDRHFMGTIVLQPNKQDKHVSVIDGQQRLATFTVLLVILHQLAPQYDSTLRISLGYMVKKGEFRKFRPTLRDRDAFEVLVENPDLLRKVAHRYVHDCYGFFSKKIANYIETEKGQKPTHFRKIQEAILDKMYVVSLRLATNDDAQAIFETINYVGVPLTPADLARNFVLSRVSNPAEQQRINREYWQKIEAALQNAIPAPTKKAKQAQMQKEFPNFLRSMLVVERKKYISFSDLYRELKVYYKQGRLETKLALTLSYAKIFGKFLNPEDESQKKLQVQLTRFSRLKMATHYPVLLVLYRAHSAHRMKSVDLLTAMRYIESFVVRRAFNSKVSRLVSTGF